MTRHRISTADLVKMQCRMSTHLGRFPAGDDLNNRDEVRLDADGRVRPYRDGDRRFGFVQGHYLEGERAWVIVDERDIPGTVPAMRAGGV